MPPHYVLFVRGKSLVTQQINLERPGFVGDPIPTGVSLPGSVGVSGSRYLSAGGTATIAHRQLLGDSTRLVWVDRSGRELAIACEDGAWHLAPRLSPDGNKIAVAHYDYGGESGDIHVHDAERQLDIRVTYDENDDQQAVWSPDGRELATSTIAAGEPSSTYIVDPSRPGERRLRWRAETTTYVQDWFVDGGLLLKVNAGDGRSDLYRLPPDAEADLVPIVVTPFSDHTASLSSDDRWLAYVSDSTGRVEVYVRALDSGEQWRVSKAGGFAPKWRGDDRELFYVDSRGYFVAVPTTLGATFTMGTPEVLFEGLLDAEAGRQYDVTADGQRFILNRPEKTEEQPIIVTIDLPEEFLAGGGR